MFLNRLCLHLLQTPLPEYNILETRQMKILEQLCELKDQIEGLCVSIRLSDISKSSKSGTCASQVGNLFLTDQVHSYTYACNKNVNIQFAGACLCRNNFVCQSNQSSIFNNSSAKNLERHQIQCTNPLSFFCIQC